MIVIARLMRFAILLEISLIALSVRRISWSVWLISYLPLLSFIPASSCLKAYRSAAFTPHWAGWTDFFVSDFKLK